MLEDFKAKLGQRGAKLRGTRLCKTPACYGSDGWAALNFRPDDQVKHPNAVKIYFVIFDLNDRSRRVEIPLLLDQGTQRVSLIR